MSRWARSTALVPLVVIVAVLIALQQSAASAQQSTAAPPATSSHRYVTDGATLDATAWVVMEAATGEILASHREQEIGAVASTIKVLTALVVLDHAELDDAVTVGPEVQGVAGAGVGLQPGDVWTVSDMLDALIARSGNDAAETLAIHVAGTREAFLDAMLDKARAIGMAPIVLASPSGLGDENLVSAVALAELGRAALANPTLRPFLGRRFVDLPTEGRTENRNQLLFDYPGATGIKTGFTRAAGNSLIGSATRAGRELVVVVLGASTENARFDVAAHLLDTTFMQTALVELAPVAAFTRAGGAVELAMDPVARTFGRDATIDFAPVSIGPHGTVLELDVVVDGIIVERLTLEQRTATAPVSDQPGARVSTATVDTVYDVLRRATMMDMLG